MCVSAFVTSVVSHLGPRSTAPVSLRVSARPCRERRAGPSLLTLSPLGPARLSGCTSFLPLQPFSCWLERGFCLVRCVIQRQTPELCGSQVRETKAAVSSSFHVQHTSLLLPDMSLLQPRDVPPYRPVNQTSRKPAAEPRKLRILLSRAITAPPPRLFGLTINIQSATWKCETHVNIECFPLWTLTL